MAQDLLHLRYVKSFFFPKRRKIIIVIIIIIIITIIFCFLGLCKKRLDSTNATEHNGDLWCKVCYSRKFGPKGVGFGCGAGTLNMDKVGGLILFNARIRIEFDTFNR